MKIFNDSKFGKLREPENFNEFIDIFIKGNSDGRKVQYWRGQSDIEWRIDSSGYRRMLNTELHNKVLNRYLFDYEKDLLEHATHKGYRYQDGRTLFDFELLAKLQHHGAATRLVDFSKNALIGLWFSIMGNAQNTGLLIGIHTDIIVGHENKLQQNTYQEIIKECESTDQIYTWEPTNISPRMAAQHSQFLYSRVSEDKRGSLILPAEEDYITLIAVNPKLKEELRYILESVFDIWTLSVFPDIDGFGSANRFDISRWNMDRW